MAASTQGFGRIGVACNTHVCSIDALSSHASLASPCYELSMNLIVRSKFSAALHGENGVSHPCNLGFRRSCHQLRTPQHPWKKIGKARATATPPGSGDSEDGSEEEGLKAGDKSQKERQEGETAGEETQDVDISSEQAEIGEFRQRLQGMVDTEHAEFSGKDLATIIRNKYGKSYDVQFIRKEFFGRQLLAMNIMWKYQEQRSFPLTEEEYLIRLDGVAEYLRLWGAVAYVRNSLEKTKERPRVGKAVSILIDLDQKGWRKEEWDIR